VALSPRMRDRALDVADDYGAGLAAALYPSGANAA
jgi:hypothetical protein